MNQHTWMILGASVALGCAAPPSPPKPAAHAPVLVTAAPANRAGEGDLRASRGAPPLLDRPREVIACAAVGAARDGSWPDRGPAGAAPPHDARRASEALDRLAMRIRISDERRGWVITLPSDELVEEGRWALGPVARFSLDKLVGALRAQDGRLILVQGYTDSLGPAASNDALSLRRAEAVCEYLVAQGVPVEALRVEGLGARRPMGDNATAEGRSRNRRVEIVIAR